MTEELPKVQAVEVSSLADLARLAASMVSYAVVMPIYRFYLNGKAYYFVQTTYRDYFKYYGIPIIYYYKEESSPGREEGQRYVLLKVDESGEKVELSDRSRPGWTPIPIINLRSKPPFIEL